MSFTPHKILITGGAGFIGSHFIIYLLQRYSDIEIFNLDKLTYAANLRNLEEVNQSKNYHFLKGDILDSNLITQILTEFKIDTIVNFAAESHVDRSIDDPAPFIETNIHGTYNLLQCSFQYWRKQFNLNPEKCRFHQISTDEVYGCLKIDDPAFTENSPYHPNSPYSASKASADHLVQAYFRTYKLPITISNCSNNYGANQHIEKLIPKIIHNCINQQPIPIYNDGSNIRDWIFVEDHCRGIDAILRQAPIGQHYNLGGNEELDNLTIVQLVCDEFDKIFPENLPHRRLITFVKDRPGHDFRYAINNNLLYSITGWQPKIRLRETLEHLIQLKLLAYAT